MPVEKPLATGEPLANDPKEQFEDIIELEIEEEGALYDEGAPEEPVGFYDNLADFMSEDDLEAIGGDILAVVKEDETSREDWEATLKDGINLLGLETVSEDTDVPFEGATSSAHPLLMESITKFQSKASTSMSPTGGPVKTLIVGESSPDLENQAMRVRTHMNYQITEQIFDYYEQQDKMLMWVGFTGSAFKKLYWDPITQQPRSDFVRAEHFIINYNATSLRTAQRYAHRMEMSSNDVRQYQIAGFYRDLELYEPTNDEDSEVDEAVKGAEGRTGPSVLDEGVHIVYEVHLNFDMPGFEDEQGIQLPYIVTIEEESGIVLSIRRNWKEDDASRTKRIWFTHYGLVPGFGFYNYGYIHLIGGLARSATSIMRQLIDAGMFANIPAGFKAKGLRVSGDDEPLRPGEWRDINAPAMDLGKSLLPLPYKEPSTTLFNLLGFVVDAGAKFADATEQVVAESTNYGPVGTTMALLEAGGKLFSAIHKRLFRSQRDELRILARLNAENLDEKVQFNTAGQNNFISGSDYDERVDILPVTDPDSPSEAQRVARANMVLETAARFPQEHNLRSAVELMYRSAGIPDDMLSAVLKPLPQEAQPRDPVSENMAAMTGQPLSAAPYQDQDAHIEVHSSFMVNPMYSHNQQAMVQLGAHVMEHLALKYHQEIQEEMGVELPPLGEQLPPEVENEIALRAAAAAEAILRQGQNEEVQDQQDELENDPMFQLQKNEQTLRAMDISEKARHNMAMEEIAKDKLRHQMLEDAIDNARDKWKTELETDTRLATEKMRSESFRNRNKD